MASWMESFGGRLFLLDKDTVSQLWARRALVLKSKHGRLIVLDRVSAMAEILSHSSAWISENVDIDTATRASFLVLAAQDYNRVFPRL